MIEKDEIKEVLKEYDLGKAKLGMIASHSALDVCDGAIEEGFETLVICQKGREYIEN
jgi:5-formaminoimidazole-4-carboxamide-1-(beta)-D-ribofuranosyl 5'-monophosphate synthetase